MLLAEDLLLLVTNDATGRLSVSGEVVDAGLGGANLVELTLRGQVDVSGEQDQDRRGRIIVRDPSLPGDEVLDAALRIPAARQGRKAVRHDQAARQEPAAGALPGAGGPRGAARRC